MLILNSKISCKPEFFLLKKDEMCKAKSELQLYSTRKSVFFENIVICKSKNVKFRQETQFRCRCRQKRFKFSYIFIILSLPQHSLYNKYNCKEMS